MAVKKENNLFYISFTREYVYVSEKPAGWDACYFFYLIPSFIWNTKERSVFLTKSGYNACGNGKTYSRRGVMV